LTYANSNNNRAAVNVFNLPAGSTVQAWFFGTFNNYFNQINEQIFTITTSSQLTFNLANPPRNMEPVVAGAIVEYYDPVSGITRQLTPPHIDYYQVTTSTETTFVIKNQGTFDWTNGSVRVYQNSNRLMGGVDFTVAGQLVTITSAVSIDDVIAIVNMPTGLFQDYQYDIVDSTLTLKPGVINSQQSWTPVSTGEIRVLTYTDYDNSLIRTERFDGTPNRRFKVSRPVYNIDYVRVNINGVPLTAGLDYEVLDDQLTIQISDAFTIKRTDFVVITSLASQRLATHVVGFRIFNDMFNRTHFKRLSKENTTYITRPLSITDTEIHLNDSSAIVPPLLSKNIPGVVIIDSERIEFFVIENNVLKQLRRGTLGTSPSMYSEVGTKVIDQSPAQTIPFTESIKNQVIFTENSVTTYVINTSTEIVSIPGTADTIVSDGIVLATSPITSAPIHAVDQVSIYYGGRLLRKHGVYAQDTTVSFDGPEVNVTNISSTSSVHLLPTTNTIGTAYNVTATNQVWVYTASIELDAVNGYVYRGLNYVPPEFTITTSTQELTLNIASGIDSDIKLEIIKKEFYNTDIWNDVDISNINKTISIVDSQTMPAKFLRDRPAELPDAYYYGGDIALTDSGGSPLLDENDNPLEGH
jgi:hypothetical protein